jgi:hypothetical protein
LQELDGEDWGDPTFDSSVVVNVHRLRRVPLRDFRVEDLRLMVGQNIGLEQLVPIALEHLEQNPFAEGDHYPGDLLSSVIKVPNSFWDQAPSLKVRIQKIIATALAQFCLADSIPELESELRRSRDRIK